MKPEHRSCHNNYLFSVIMKYMQNYLQTQRIKLFKNMAEPTGQTKDENQIDD